ncbi:MAG: hypothetical protein ABEL04_14070 [Salinibacter sp.]|uniref:hypothetical protein n=1 Tax=Salinibacter sp. TaxID=2065818 RepID=UPI0035D4D937
MTPRQQSVLVGAVGAGILGTSYFDFVPDHLVFLNLLEVIAAPIFGGIVAVQRYTSRAGTSIGSKLEAGGAELFLGPVLGALAAAGGLVISTILNQALRMANLGAQGQMRVAPQMQEASPKTIVAAVATIVGVAALHCIVGAIGGTIGAAIFGADE